MEGARGGNALHGLISSAISTAGNTGIVKYGGRIGDVGRIVGAAIVGGTASQLGGGKFANGAVTGAYIMMFNCNNKRKQEAILKKKEAELLFKMYMHYQQGGGKDFVVNAFELDFSYTSQKELGLSELNIGGSVDPVDLFGTKKNAYGFAFGQVMMTKVAEDLFYIHDNKFDFDIHWDKGFTERNIVTFYGGAFMNNFLPLGPGFTKVLPFGPGQPLIQGGGYNVIFIGFARISKE